MVILKDYSIDILLLREIKLDAVFFHRLLEKPLKEESQVKRGRGRPRKTI